MWLPSEAQLRERLGGAFRRLSRVDGRWRVEIDALGAPAQFDADDAAEAYGTALLHLVTLALT